jgi:hypothetical protein
MQIVAFEASTLQGYLDYQKLLYYVIGIEELGWTMTNDSQIEIYDRLRKI